MLAIVLDVGRVYCERNSPLVVGCGLRSGLPRYQLVDRRHSSLLQGKRNGRHIRRDGANDRRSGKNAGLSVVEVGQGEDGLGCTYCVADCVRVCAVAGQRASA